MKKVLIRSVLVLGVLILGLLAFVAIPVDPTIPAIEPGDDTRYWTMEADHRIAYTRVPAQGDSAKAPIVVLHGGPGGYIHSSYVETFGRLAALGHDVYLYDQVGSGRSDRLPKPKDYTFLGHARDLREIITTHLGGGPVILIGQSYGGKLASYVVAHHPDLVKKAVLTSPGGFEPPLFDEDGQWVNEARYPVPDSLAFRDPPDAARDMGISSWPLRSITSIALATTLNQKLMSDAEADGVLNTVATKITRGMVCDAANVQPEEGGGGFYAHGWSNWYGGVEDWRPAFQAADVPLLVIQGQCDFIPYAEAYEYVALAPNSTYRFIEEAGHIVWWEQPDTLVAVIAQFLSHRPNVVPMME